MSTAVIIACGALNGMLLYLIYRGALLALRRARRDYFAAMAMQAMTCGHFTHHGHSEYWPPKDIAEEAYDRADAMLAARKTGGAA